MPVHGLDHYNLRASRDVLDELCSFYCEVVGLSLGKRPPFTHFGYWLYAGEIAVLHLSQADETEICAAEVASAFSHAAFNWTGRMAIERRLSELDIAYEVAHIPQSGQTQLFFQDPAGNGVELIFDGEDPC